MLLGGDTMGLGFSTFETARSGLFVNERGLYVTGHNISNVNTTGYVRQQAIITTGPYKELVGKGQIGLGADVQMVRQIRHSFIDNIFRQESNSLGYWEAKNKTFEDIQAILSEPMERGLQNVMNQFWDSWQELSKNPDSLTVRSLVRQRSDSLVGQINHIGLQFDKLQDDLNSEIKVRIEEVNKITESIAKLNVEILKIEVSKDNANDFRDQRNLLLDKLSKLVNIEIHENVDGQVDITASGYYLVTKGVQNIVFAAEQQEGGLFYVPKVAGTDIDAPFHGGTIKGLLESRGEVIGLPGSESNGSPNAKADIVFAVDTSDSSQGYLDNVKASIGKYVKELKDRGIDYNLSLVTYGNGVLSNNNYGNDGDSFIGAVEGLAYDSGDTSNDFGALVSQISSMNFRDNSNRYSMIFTNESIGGNEVQVDSTVSQGYVETLKGLNIKTSVVSSNSFMNEGDTPAEAGWNFIAEGTGGNTYDIDAGDYEALMGDMVSDINSDVNKGISVVEDTTNIVPDIRKKLNALINIMVREVNYWHRQGKTLGANSKDGEDYFVPIDNRYPMQMGNIKINDNISNVNNIVASKTGAAGDNSIAQKIANLRNASLIDDFKGILDMDDYYQKIILAVGNGGSEAANISMNQSKLVQSSEDFRQSVMAVSMDEELANMMKYKFAYSACSRLVGVVDEMIDTIINKVGLVGR